MSDLKYCATTIHKLLTEPRDVEFTPAEFRSIALLANQEVVRLQDRISMLSINLRAVTNQLNEN